MPKRSLIDQLNEAVEVIIARPEAKLPSVDRSLAPLLRIAAELRHLPRPEFKPHLKSDLERKASMVNQEIKPVHAIPEGLTKQQSGRAKPEQKAAVDAIPKGYRTVTPYLVAPDAAGLIEFVNRTFGGEETFRTIGPGGGFHAEVRVGDSMLMIGGGGPGLSWRGAAIPGAFHVYVRDCDAAYERALQAGAASIGEPVDQFYGERSGAVKDAAGNYWYIATRKGESYKWEGAPDIQPYLHPLRADPVINFLKRAFGAEELGRHASPDGVIHHVMIKIGNAHMEMGEAHGPFQPMPAMFYLYVPDCDEVYQRALAAGGTSIAEPKDQPYGDRSGGVKDPFGNQWYIATHIRDEVL